jgi:hypothetical protein
MRVATPHSSVGGRCKLRCLKLEIKCAVEPLLEVLESNTSEHTFQQRSPTTLPVWLRDARASRFSPPKVQRRIILACYRPRNIHLAAGARKRPVLGGVCYEFVQGHGKVLGIMRANGDWYALDGHVTRPERIQFRLDKLMQLDPAPIRPEDLLIDSR